MLARSVPPPGSVKHADAMQRPLAISGNQRCFCASLPCSRIVRAASELLTLITDASTQSIRAISSQITP